MPQYIQAGDHVSKGKTRGKGHTLTAPEREVDEDYDPGPRRITRLPLALWGYSREAADALREGWARLDGERGER